MPASVGASAPPLILPDPRTGEMFDLATLAGRDALVLFVRGTWCPFCRQQLAALSEAKAKLDAAGIVPIAIACQSEASLRRWQERNPLPFALLADSRRSAAKAWGTHYWLGWDGFNLSHPALFIVGRSGTVRFARIGRHMADLPIPVILAQFLLALGAEDGKNDRV